MLYRWALFLCALLLTETAFSQVNHERITISGAVFNKADNTTVPFVNIYNVRNGRGTTSAIDGSFLITVLMGDTIRFTSIGYADFNLIADSSVSRIGIKIYLVKANYMLGPVTVTPENGEAMPMSQDSFIRNLRLPPAPREMGPVAGSQAAGTLFNFGGDKNLKDMQRQNAEIDKWKAENAYAGRYNRNTVMHLTGLPDDKVDDFMKFCALKADFIQSANDYDLLVAIKDCYKNYQEKHPELKQP